MKLLKRPGIDLGRDRCVGRTYTRLADIYLGDVSSQIYEFIVDPRPAVFLNAHQRRDWEDDVNLRHWSLGTVIDDPGGLGLALRRVRCILEHLRERSRAEQAPAYSHLPPANGSHVSAIGREGNLVR